MWTQENVIVKLEENESYKDFFSEDEGETSCTYNIDGVTVVIFNEVGGKTINVSFVAPLPDAINIESAQSFAKIAHQYLNNKIKHKQ
jgi:hypothetical protein